MTARLAETFLDEVRARTSMVDLIGRDVPLTRAGRECVGLCPFHEDSSPSFSVNEAKGFYFCFGCGAHGDPIDWLVNRHHLSFRDAVERLAYRAGLATPDGQVPRDLPPLAPLVKRETPEDRAREEARSIAAARTVWHAAVAATGTVVEAYLRWRGLTAWPDGRIPPTLRFVRLHYWWAEKPNSARVSLGLVPAMVAALQGPDGKLRGVHLTYLAADGAGKASILDPKTGKTLPSKKMRGVAMGSAIRLAPIGDEVGIGEGIENAASVLIDTGLCCWAAGSLNNMAGAGRERGRPHPRLLGRDGLPLLLPSPIPDLQRPGITLPPLPQAGRVVLLEDADSDPLVMAAMMARARARFEAEGRHVERRRPPEGMDFNDALRGAA